MTNDDDGNTYPRAGIFGGEDEMNAANSSWYIKKRRNIETRWKDSKPLTDKVETFTSPCGTYTLRITPCAFDLHRNWAYTVGDVFGKTYNGRIPVAQVLRDHQAFPFTWCVQHPDGHDYLLCAEDYQGMTVIRLDTGERVDYIEEDAETNQGFSWAESKVSPDKTRIAIEGGYWAQGFEVHILDFRAPLALPYTRVGKDFVKYHDRLVGWQGNDRVLVEREQEYRASDAAPLSSLSDEERVEAIAAPGGTRNKKVIWSVGLDGRHEEVYAEWCPPKEPKKKKKDK